MIKKLFLTLFIACLTFSGSAFAAFIDQKQEVKNNSSALRKSTTEFICAQGFKPSVTNTCPKIEVFGYEGGSISAGDVWIEIQTDNGGDPSGTPVTNGTSVKQLGGDFGAGYHWVTFTFATPPSLTATTQYHIVFTGDFAVSSTNYIAWGMDFQGNPYADGIRKRGNDSIVWTDFVNDDHTFRVWMDEDAAGQLIFVTEE